LDHRPRLKADAQPELAPADGRKRLDIGLHPCRSRGGCVWGREERHYGVAHGLHHPPAVRFDRFAQLLHAGRDLFRSPRVSGRLRSRRMTAGMRSRLRPWYWPLPKTNSSASLPSRVTTISFAIFACLSARRVSSSSSGLSSTTMIIFWGIAPPSFSIGPLSTIGPRSAMTRHRSRTLGQTGGPAPRRSRASGGIAAVPSFRLLRRALSARANERAR